VATSLFAGPSFREACKDLVAKSKGGEVPGVDGWLFLKEELAHLAAGKFWGKDAATASMAKNKEFADPVPAIVEYNQLLKDKGITLYLMPVPPKALVYPDKIADGIDLAAATAELALYKEFYALLSASGVQVIDLLPDLLKNRDSSKVYCQTDTHFSGQGLALFAEAATNMVKKEKWYAAFPKGDFGFSPQKISINSDLARMAGKKDLVEELDITIVRDKKNGKVLNSDLKSPVILLGDSHTLVFNSGGDLYATGAGLFDHISAQLGFPVDLLGVRGSGVTPARVQLFQRSKQDGSYLEGKKVLIWCFAARDFTGSGGWRKIPVAP
jgi:alginate O-acetyltransferase complex protein AlgJ